MSSQAVTAARVVRLRPRSVVALVAATVVGVVGFGWPLLDARLAGTSESSSHASDAPWLFIGLLSLLLVVVLAEVSEGGIDAKAVAVLGVLAGCGAALRPLSGGATGFSFVFFLLIPAGRVLGRSFGFVLGAVTLLASALLTGQVGPWLPFEMLGCAWTGFGAGCLPRASGRAEVALLAAYGAVSGLLYGLLLNLSFWPFARYLSPQIAFVPGGSIRTNVVHWVRFDLTTSLGFDIPRAVGNALLVLLLGGPLLAALRRVARRANFEAVAEFDEPTPAVPAM
jgi:energy-coupling factor transport system substrate-specific component